jgi:hypothetical protein
MPTSGPCRPASDSISYDVSPDGKRIMRLVDDAEPEDRKPLNHAIFLFNFADELPRRAARREK